jgi:hypothetical protein
MKAYRSRAKVGIEASRLWLADSPDWKPRSVGTTRVSRNGSPTKSAGTTPPATDEMKAEAGGYVPHRSPLIENPFPLRPGVSALITVPEDLTEAEAKRLAKFVETLAVPRSANHHRRGAGRVVQLPGLGEAEKRHDVGNGDIDQHRPGGRGHPALRRVQVVEAGEPRVEGMKLAGIRDAEPEPPEPPKRALERS